MKEKIMTQTDFGALTPLQKKVWLARVINAGRDDSFFFGKGGAGLVGKGVEDATKPIHLITELTETERGSKVVIPLVQDLVNDGVVGDNKLEDNEEELVADEQEIEIDQLRHAVKRKGKMSEQRTTLRFRKQAKDKLSFWKYDTLDELMFLTASGVSYSKRTDGSDRAATSQLNSLRFAGDITTPSTNRVIYAGTATSTATLTTSDKMNWNLIVQACALAKRKHVKPVRIGGKSHYIIVMSPEQARDLKVDSDYKSILSQAGSRGGKNELFTGAFAHIDGVYLYEHNKTYNTLGLAASSKWGASGTVDGAQALLLGAQALGFAELDGGSDWSESDNTDYGNKIGIAYSCIIGMLKTKYKSIYENDTSNPSEDFSIISIYTAAAASSN
jgi:N4-gp56 family major capsid protein